MEYNTMYIMIKNNKSQHKIAYRHAYVMHLLFVCMEIMIVLLKFLILTMKFATDTIIYIIVLFPNVI